MITPAQVQAAYIRACYLDIEALKPGNVSHCAPGHHMEAAAFKASAQVTAPVLAGTGIQLGQRIYEAVAATKSTVGCNTNLGIILLCAPLAQAALNHAGGSFRTTVADVLQETTVDDTEKVYQAIRLAAPGGLGASPAHDVAADPAVNLRTAMSHAASWDQIASEYANSFEGLWDRVLPTLDAALERWGGDLRWATTDLYLYLLANQPDTHVCRRNGTRAAQELCDQASSMHRLFLNSENRAFVRRELERMDGCLKNAGINPGTTADLVVAGHCLARLRDSRALFAGAHPGSTSGSIGFRQGVV